MGTCTAVGEMRAVMAERSMAAPIVIFDEAGQVGTFGWSAHFWHGLFCEGSFGELLISEGGDVLVGGRPSA